YFCVFAAGRSLNDTEGPATSGLPCEFSGAKNGCRRGLVNEVSGCKPLWRPSDSARIKKVGLGAIEAEEIVRASGSEVSKNVSALEKERPLFGKECFEGAEVHDSGIDFDLAEVRIHRSIQSDVAADSILDVEAGSAK